MELMSEDGAALAQPSALESRAGQTLSLEPVPHRPRGGDGFSRSLLARALLIAAVAVVGLVAGVGIYRRFETQQAENAALVRQLAALTIERDDLLAARDQLTAELERIAGELEHERARAQQAEASASDLTTRQEEANSRIATLQRAAEASAAENQRLNDEVATLRARTEAARQSASDASAAAAAEAEARRRAERIGIALLEYADAAANLSKTRDQMIDLLLRQSAALRAGQWAAADQLVAEYNRLVPVHNQQVNAANAALARLLSLL
jgi:chromosome segregation ATPase